jgi:hypothetical protein
LWTPLTDALIQNPGINKPFILLYNILGFVRLRWWWSSFPSIRPVIHPSKFLIPEEEDDGRGGGKTPVVLQFAKGYKLI